MEKKWITVQVDLDIHKKLHTAAVSKSMKLKDYVATVLEQHAEKLDVIIRDSEQH